ncbi:MAG: SDR family oxidoreductase [Candidatus Micrarchaeia archaeon]|jgi:dTDP-4-dehydrorhamnose reductase
MRIIITGASGLLGSNIALSARSKGHEVLGTYNSHKLRDNRHFFRFDLLEPTKHGASRIISFKPDCIVHCAAITNLDFCENYPDLAMRVNVDGSRIMAQLADEAGCKFILISTDSVFDGTRPNHNEGEPVSPLNIYAKSKCGAEEAARSLKNHAIIRTNFYGFSICSMKSYGEWLYGFFMHSKRIPAFTDYFFSPVLANNLAEALLELASSSFTGTLNIASDARLTKYDFAHRFAAAFSFDPRLIDAAKMSDREDFIAPRPKDCSLDASKAKQVLLTPLLGIDEGILRFKGLLEEGYPAKIKHMWAQPHQELPPHSDRKA